ncbi:MULTISPECIES: GNAT family N-acetyltransferase [Micromonospora]|uniref:Acetyltransferase n=1 Tax=Micromonospora maris TaxID=1003110 RepID=A0A9X0I862_9ACTN|nr:MULTISPECIES: GNAT family N-acetyltransferase [Micromonospora]AEB43459.1 gcn5-related n-acetyltransferase [Micromonospora maris AB-18-032]KUJ48774.1 acetyltransferase [Micromonospora maris]RUL92917.1 N-acetyltransferase [Verrucosispora sp. FIM060022]
MTVASTDRLVLREWTDSPDDLARIFDIYSREDVMRWLGGGAGRLLDPDQAAERLATWRQRYAPYDGRYGLWAIEVRDTRTVAGSVLLKPLPGADGHTPTDDIEVGWHLHPDSWGHGYATEAARAVLAREFAAGNRQVYAVVMPGNERSMAVCRRLGMSSLGRRTDWYGGTEVETFVLTGE